MRCRSLSRRPTITVVLAAAVAVALAALGASFAVAGRPAAPDPPPSLERIVARTLATGSARIDGTISTGGDEPGTITGQAAFGRPESAFVVRAPGGGGPAEVRVREDGAWILAPGATHWVAVRSLPTTGAAGHWADVIGEVARATDVRSTRGGREVTGRLGRRAVVVDVDARGRIARLAVRGGASTLDVRLHDLGAPVAVALPAPVESTQEP